MENSRGQRPFFWRKPLRRRLDRSWKIAALAEPQKKPRHAKSHHRVDQCVAHRRQAPNGGPDGIPLPAAQPVDKTPREDHAQCISNLEAPDDVPILDFIEADGPLDSRPSMEERLQMKFALLQHRLENRKNLPVHV